MTEARSFGRYKVTGTLGSGAMGEVYAAVDDVLGRQVAVKTLRGRQTGLAARMLDERFRLEARAVASLVHPGIVQVYDIDLAAEQPYLVMERVAGPSLKERFAEGVLPEAELRALGIQIARALAAAHAADIVHRDVKPANILIAGGGTWKLVDFGVAHVPDSSLTLTGQFVGSPAYAPPEALVRGQCTPAGDVYGLGATLYLGAAGSWPRSDATTGALLAPVPSLATFAPHLPADLIATIDRAVAGDPEQRPTAAELADALAQVAIPHTQSEPMPMPEPGSLPPAMSLPHLPPWHGMRWKHWAIGAAAIAILILLAVVIGHSPDAKLGAATATPPAAAPATPPAAPAAQPARDPNAPITIHARPPATSDRRMAKDWNKIVDALYEHRWNEAKRKLDDWEGRWGETTESRDLRSQLTALPPEVLHEAD